MELKVGGRKVYAATGGKAFDATRPTIVFIHGAGFDHTCWQLQSRWFAWHGWSVLAVDLPAHGRSEGPPLESLDAMCDWVVAVLDAAGVGKAALVGHSMGAVIALETTARHAARVSGLALVGVSAAMPVHPDLLGAARETPDRAYEMMTGWGFGPGAKLGGNTAPGLWMTGGAMAVLERGRERALAADLAACSTWKTGPQSAASVTLPTLFVLGARDMMTPARKGQELAAAMGAPSTVKIASVGHMLMQEAPDFTLDALIAHFGAAR